MKVPNRISSDLRTLFDQKFPDFKETWERNRLYFIWRLNAFTLKVETPVQQNSEGDLLPLASRQIDFFLFSDHAPDKSFQWRSSRIDLNMKKLITERLEILREFVSQIKICPQCGEAYPFPYLTGIGRSRDPNAHYFQLSCPCCGAILSPTEDRHLEKRCNQILMNTRGIHTIKKQPPEEKKPAPPDKVEIEEEPTRKGGDPFIKEVIFTMHREDALNPYFRIHRSKSCKLGMKDFAKSDHPGKLACMFFKGSHLKLEIDGISCKLEATEIMDCKLDGTEMKAGVKYELRPNVSYLLAIDDVLYNVVAVT